MKLRLIRRFNCDKYCIGSLYINDKYFCDVLEDTDRGLDSRMPLKELLKIKVKGKTAIPTGTYRIDMNTVSPRFSKKQVYKFCNGKLPRLVNVLAYDGVLMHIGNKPEDTDGCLLVGQNKVKGQVINSTVTFINLYDRLRCVKPKEEIWITIERTYKV